jgi:hypothetical protein
MLTQPCTSKTPDSFNYLLDIRFSSTIRLNARPRRTRLPARRLSGEQRTNCPKPLFIRRRFFRPSIPLDLRQSRGLCGPDTVLTPGTCMCSSPCAPYTVRGSRNPRDSDTQHVSSFQAGNDKDFVRLDTRRHNESARLEALGFICLEYLSSVAVAWMQRLGAGQDSPECACHPGVLHPGDGTRP